MAKVTMREVAKHAGVSPATVSRAMRNPDLVNPETLQRVQDAIRATRYNYPAPPKETDVSRTIGVMLPTTQTPAFSDTLLGIQEVALGLYYMVTVGATGYDAAVERKLLEQFMNQPLGGLIMFGYSLSNERLVRRIARSGVPCVVVWEINRDQTINYIGFDNHRAFAELTGYVIGLGHRRIGLICGPFSKCDRAQRRLNGYRSALELNRIPYDPSLVYEGIPSLQDGEAGFRHIMSRKDPPTAVMGGADMLALGALATAQKMGISVPADISLTGFDDIPFSAYSHPTLTTVRVPAYEIGVKAMEVIRGTYDQNKDVVHHCFETQLIIRESCKCVSQPT